MKKHIKLIVIVLSMTLTLGGFVGCSVSNDESKVSECQTAEEAGFDPNKTEESIKTDGTKVENGGEIPNGEPSGCMEVSGVFTGVISKIDGDLAIIIPNENEEIRKYGDAVNINIEKYQQLEVGDLVSVAYKDEVEKSNPVKINAVLIEKENLDNTQNSYEKVEINPLH